MQIRFELLPDDCRAIKAWALAPGRVYWEVAMRSRRAWIKGLLTSGGFLAVAACVTIVDLPNLGYGGIRALLIIGLLGWLLSLARAGDARNYLGKSRERIDRWIMYMGAWPEARWTELAVTDEGLRETHASGEALHRWGAVRRVSLEGGMAQIGVRLRIGSSYLPECVFGSPEAAAAFVAELRRRREASGDTWDHRAIAHLAKTDFPCPKCKYNMRGVRDMRCPECGYELADTWE
jgi:hypothetical protein